METRYWSSSCLFASVCSYIITRQCYVIPHPVGSTLVRDPPALTWDATALCHLVSKSCKSLGVSISRKALLGVHELVGGFVPSTCFFFFKNRAQLSRQKKEKNTWTHTPRDNYFTLFNNIAQSMAMQ